VRFGDPEAQVVLPMIDEPLTPILWAAANGVLRSSQVRVRPEPHVGVVIAAEGYPGEPRTGQRIRIDEGGDTLMFFAGVKEQDGELVTSGGRVMTVVGRGASLDDAIARAYDGVSRVHFEGMQYRRDIGQKALALSRLS
jgi:phosphoribosylamine--glycine ligase